MNTRERREDTGAVELRSPVPASLIFRLRGEEVELDARVVQATANTLVVELGSGAGTLALATARRCEIVAHVDGVELRAMTRPGRRVDDVPDATRIELVVTNGSTLVERLR